MEGIGKHYIPSIQAETIKKHISALGYKVRVRTDVETELYKDFYDFACAPGKYPPVNHPPEHSSPKPLQERHCKAFTIELLSNSSDRLAGCVATNLYRSGVSDDNQILEVDFLAIAPSVQRGGLGTLLMQYLIETMKGLPVQKIILEPKDVSEDFYIKKLNMRRICLPNKDIQMELILAKPTADDK